MVCPLPITTAVCATDTFISFGGSGRNNLEMQRETVVVCVCILDAHLDAILQLLAQQHA